MSESAPGIGQGAASGQRPRFTFAFEAFRPLVAVLTSVADGPPRKQFVDPLGDSAAVDFTVRGIVLTLEYDIWTDTTLSAPLGRHEALASIRELVDTREHPILDAQDYPGWAAVQHVTVADGRDSPSIPSSAMRTALNVSGVLFLLVGCVWILQGVNILPGSFMTGQTKWAVYGGLLVVAGIVLLFSARRRFRE
jgi:hypothetical protein